MVGQKLLATFSLAKGKKKQIFNHKKLVV